MNRLINHHCRLFVWLVRARASNAGSDAYNILKLLTPAVFHSFLRFLIKTFPVLYINSLKRISSKFPTTYFHSFLKPILINLEPALHQRTDLFSDIGSIYLAKTKRGSTEMNARQVNHSLSTDINK